ncbi:pentapeptide repeat-containing protein [Mycolicibacterium sphagni]|uniref:Pentapeptide repeat-containing protein n=1 Tax=Mycolicibacterium sphagni TaxID=1786 RepID=A0A255DLX0_9MYCO|nr:pentapeptide repeat-containing protein [Mycolicibacterium sphagni]OYN78225.1 hypothetical protein CG716_16635 [Mycolicibacterium sphagni]
MVATAGSTIEQFMDRVGTWLSTFPANPITDLLTGGLWPLRGTLFPVGCDVGLWGTAACVAAKDCSGKSLSGADLQREDLSGDSLTDANLSNANLTNSGQYARRRHIETCCRRLTCRMRSVFEVDSD